MDYRLLLYLPSTIPSSLNEAAYPSTFIMVGVVVVGMVGVIGVGMVGMVGVMVSGVVVVVVMVGVLVLVGWCGCCGT